jgi:hypothetical protein
MAKMAFDDSKYLDVDDQLDESESEDKDDDIAAKSGQGHSQKNQTNYICTILIVM